MSNPQETESRTDPRRVRHAIEHYCMIAFLFALSLVPFRFVSWTGNRIGDLMRLSLAKRRRIVRAQAGEALNLREPELDAFVKENFRHYGNVIAEFAKLMRMAPGDFRRLIDISGFADLVAGFRDEGRGHIFVTMHFGNWEWANAAIVAAGDDGGSIARPLDNPRVNDLVKRVREKNGLRILDKRGAIRKALGILKNNGAVCILNDQDAGPSGLMSPFLGKPASTLTIPIELSMRTGAPIIVGALMRNRPGAEKRFTPVCSPIVFRPDAEADPEAEKRRLVDATNAELGKLIMKAPEQWFWIHRRWKSEGKR